MKFIVAGLVCVLGALTPSLAAAQPRIIVSDSKPYTPTGATPGATGSIGECVRHATEVLNGLHLDGVALAGSHQVTAHKGDYTALIDCTDGTRAIFAVAGPWWQYSVISLYALMNTW